VTISTILVGCDLSEGSDQALDRAIPIAEKHGARIVLVHAQADDAPIADVDNDALAQLGEVSAAIRVAEARELASAASRRTSSAASVRRARSSRKLRPKKPRI
jgi:nucleotide-binding universal stress UspA family protein